MRILAIETSCDETAIAILDNFKLLSNQVLSQIKIHRPYGGVVPNLAMREHRKNLPVLLKRALEDLTPLAPLSLRRRWGRGVRLSSASANPGIDAIAVTSGPGLEPALWEGINFAKDLSKKWNAPLVGVNHLEGHIYAAWLSGENPKHEIRNPKFPLLALIVSGGHTELVFMKKHLDYKILGETLDDAAGEAFDKVARMLGLGYPGGPEIAKLAEKFKTPTFILPLRKGEENLSLHPLPTYEGGRVGGKGLFPRPMINSPDFNFSFSGLKTAVLYYLRDNPHANKSAVAHEFQQAVVDVLVKKTSDALRKYKPKSLVVGGGVAANTTLRLALSDLVAKSFLNVSLHISPLWLCGDNAAMIAAAAYFKAKARKFSKPSTLKAQGNLKLG